MKIEQIYTGCLAQGAYYITDNGEAVIIDPLREIEPYLERLAKDNVQLKYILETHFHADFVSGHLDLSKATGAPIIYGPMAQPAFEASIVNDGEVLPFGKVSITAIHTPGHTLESTTYLLKDETGKEVAIFSGDTLFLGDVGRPDLAQKGNELTMEDLAGMLYDSLYNKILPLPDDVTVYPAHGAGSACGKNMMKETVDTLGNQKKINYALNQASKQDFIQAVTEGIQPPPGYFGMNVAMNKTGYKPLVEVKKQALTPLNPAAFESICDQHNALILDTRSAAEFHKGFIPQSINIGLKGDFAPWVGALIIDVKQPIVLVCDPGTEEEAVIRLSRVGFDNVLGYLENGFESWQSAGKVTDNIRRISPTSFLEEINENSLILDTRKEGEYLNGHLPQASYKTLSDINNWINTIDKQQHAYIHCAGGYRSMIAASILKARGYHNISEVEGGYNAIKNHLN